jgi:hypothetical protein
MCTVRTVLGSCAVLAYFLVLDVSADPQVSILRNFKAAPRPADLFDSFKRLVPGRIGESLQ